MNARPNANVAEQFVDPPLELITARKYLFRLPVLSPSSRRTCVVSGSVTVSVVFGIAVQPLLPTPATDENEDEKTPESVDENAPENEDEKVEPLSETNPNE